MRSKTLLILVALCILAGNAYSQNTTASISGTVSDSSGTRFLQFATVELFRGEAITQPVKSVITSDKGRFLFSGIDTGRYTLIVSHTGYAEVRKAVEVVSLTGVDVGQVTLAPAPAGLQGIVVTARKPMVEQSDDKIIFNVENDPATKTESAIDILRKTPFVSVDGDNNIQVNGQSNFKVLLNGRETAMFAQNVKEALKGFPGALITKIEVITTPSAKYDAEGVGGIINIITKKKVVGYNGSINTWYSNNGWYNVNGNVSAKFGKVGVSMHYGAGGGIDVKGRSRMETISFVPTAQFERRLLLGSRVMNNFWNFGNAEVSWELDSLHTLSFYGNVSGGHNRHQLAQDITTFYKDPIPDSVSTYTLDSRFEYPTHSIGADYIRKFASNKEKEFSIRFNSEFGTNNTFLDSEMDNEVAPDRFVINNSQARNRQYTLQSDYILPVGGSRKLEAGVKAIMRRAFSDFEGKEKANKVDDYLPSPNNTDYFSYNQDVYSGYGSFNFKKDKTTFRLGLRVEHTEVDGASVQAKRDVEQTYTNFLPNIQSSTRFGNAFTMVITYSDRIQRPFIHHLNPFRANNDPKNISFGNPDLEAQVIHSLAVQTRFTKGATFAGITFTGTYSDNMIVQYASYDAATGVTTTSSYNMGEEIGVSANGNFNTRVNDKWSVFLNGNIRYSKVKNKLRPDQVNSGFGGNANLNMNYSFSKRFNTSGYAGFFRAPVTIQTSYPLNLWYGINLGYKMFNEKLNISAGLSNFLEKERDWEMITTDPAFQYISTSTMPFRGISISLSWSFGKLTENVSKKKGVTNDDALSTGNSSN